jgi:hypothetical protein
MYWPCSFRLARRVGDSRSLRLWRGEPAEARVAASSAGTKRARDRAIDTSDLRMAWTSLLTDLVRVLGKARLHGSVEPARHGTASDVCAQDGQEMDKSATSPIHCPAKSLLELVELMGIEPMTS